MLQSKLFTKTRRESPKDEIAKNADLLIRAGYIYKEMAGVYSFLPLGLMVLNNIVSIIRKEMNDIGGQEVFLSALQDRSVWELSGRWSDEVVDNWFKTQVRNAGEAGLGFTHEEPLTRIMKDNISSWKDLPRSVYQFQTKFRNEARAKSGIMRGREFLMKDLYTFSKDNAEHELLYEEVKKAYIRIFDKLGIGGETYVTMGKRYGRGGKISWSENVEKYGRCLLF
jgi:prolyl-tRNA synthetase